MRKIAVSGLYAIFIIGGIWLLRQPTSDAWNVSQTNIPNYYETVNDTQALPAGVLFEDNSNWIGQFNVMGPSTMHLKMVCSSNSKTYVSIGTHMLEFWGSINRDFVLGSGNQDIEIGNACEADVVVTQ